MRYRVAYELGGDFVLHANGSDDFPLVHVFRDDELDELASAILDAAFDEFTVERAVDVLRNHTSERQPDSADGAG